jgi:hypothetical protein
VVRLVVVIVFIGQVIDEGYPVAVAKGQPKTSSLCTAGQDMHPIDDFRWHWELGPSVPVEDAPSSEAVKIISALFVACRTECDGPSCARHHGVVVFFMCLNVRTKFQLAVLCVVELRTNDDCAWAEHWRNAVVWRKTVQPECSIVDHFDNNTSRNALKRQGVVYTPDSFL